jgi:hypothetical protein
MPSATGRGIGLTSKNKTFNIEYLWFCVYGLPVFCVAAGFV